VYSFSQLYHHKGEEGMEYVGFPFIFPSFCALFARPAAFVVKKSKKQVIKSLSVGQV
jgi:hypothetical protein